MKKNRILSALLCLSLAAGLVIPGLPAYAEGEGESNNSSGMMLSKSAEAVDSDTYTITLEAYATGEKVISQVNKDVPTDIVLVLDQSGSMGTKDFPSVGEPTYTAYTGDKTKNSNLYSKRHNNNGSNGNLYYKLDDGSYATVSVVRTRENSYTYTQCPSDWLNNKDYGYSDCYWKYSNNLYIKVGDEYKKVTLTRDWIYGGWGYKYTYTFPDGSTFVSEGDNTSPGNFDGKGPLYVRSTTAGEYTYTYTCTDAEGKTIEIGTSTGADTNFTDAPLYYRTDTNGSNISRLEALINAVTAFTNSVANKAKGADGQLGTADDIDHRIAVVGFASGNPSDTLYHNSEVFVGAEQYRYDTTASAHYSEAFQSMKTEKGQNNIKASIKALTANGATYTNLGVEMANGILQANPVPNGEKRNRVVIVFTDGVPGRTGYSSTVAESAITQANTSRTLGASVYAVGIFEGADATSAGNQNGNNTQKANWFMQNLSNNKGTPQTPSYYLSAANSNTLNNIFQQIASNIETGGSSTTLNESAVIKDIISPAFTLPEGTDASDITLETWQCTGKSGDAYTWTKNPNAMNATATVNGDQVSVTGFDFAENYVGTVTENGKTTYRGNKLVIRFTVSPKAGFLGGNDVYTNTSAGIYENGSAENPLLTFDRPTVNVPITDVTVKPEDKNVYLLSDVELDALKNGATVMVGKVQLNLTANNYGLESWQNEYVDITVEIKDEKGNVISSDLSDLTDDATYTVAVTVSPKTDGTNASGTAATAQKGIGTANINVYKPELTYKDSEVFYGDAVPADTELAKNLTETKWKHGTSEATADMGTAPDLAITYTADSTKIANGKINSKDDIQVKATVKINDTDVTGSTTFLHTACAEGVTCGWSETTLDGDPAFLLHVKTASLTIKKQGDVTENEGFIFKVACPDGNIITVSAPGGGEVTITGLPLGTYTVTEDTGWSWRYKDGVTISDGGSVTLTEQSPKANVTVTNNKTNEYLLDGNAYAQNNSALLSAGN